LNPENGICLSALYDRAFDRGFIGFNNNLEVVFSESLKEKIATTFYNAYFKDIEDKKLGLPVKYFPSVEFLEIHMSTVFGKVDPILQELCHPTPLNN
jgi:putative restriction endonuclease